MISSPDCFGRRPGILAEVATESPSGCFIPELFTKTIYLRMALSITIAWRLHAIRLREAHRRTAGEWRESVTANGINVYLAAPLFSRAERASNKSIRDAISHFANVYLPQEDGDLILDLVRDGMPVEQAKSRIFQQDVDAIAACDVLVIVLDGRTVDEGASFELGYSALFNC